MSRRKFPRKLPPRQAGLAELRISASLPKGSYRLRIDRVGLEWDRTLVIPRENVKVNGRDWDPMIALSLKSEGRIPLLPPGVILETATLSDRGTRRPVRYKDVSLVAVSKDRVIVSIEKSNPGVTSYDFSIGFSTAERREGMEGIPIPQQIRRIKQKNSPTDWALQFDGQQSLVTIPYHYSGRHPITIELFVTPEKLGGGLFSDSGGCRFDPRSQLPAPTGELDLPHLDRTRASRPLP